MKPLSDDYVAGFLENTGCFFINHVKAKKDYPVPMFILRCKDPNKFDVALRVFKYLFEVHGIDSSIYSDNKNGQAISVTRRDCVLKLILFMENHCNLSKVNTAKVKEYCTTYKEELNKKHIERIKENNAKQGRIIGTA